MTIFSIYEHALVAQPVVLEASAGTGKTFSLTALVIRLLLEGIVDGPRPTLDGILLVTFTNKATDELRTRLRARVTLARRLWEADFSASATTDNQSLQAELATDGFLGTYYQRRVGHYSADIIRLRAAEAIIDQAPVSTIHSFCARVLAEFSGRMGLPPDVAVADDETERRATACREAWRSIISQESDAEVVQSVNSNVDDDGARDDNGVPLQFSLIEREYSAWVGADRPFIPVPADAETLRVQWLQMNLGQRLQVAMESWNSAKASPDIVVRRIAVRRAVLHAIDQRLEVTCQRDGVLTMDALQQRLRTSLRDPVLGPVLVHALKVRYPAVLIDEFQDTDPVQAQIFTTAFAHGFLRCVGDPKQSIYRFRGADLHAYLEFVRGSRIEVMEKNFRSSPGCVAVVNHLFREERKVFLQPGITFAPSQAARSNALLSDTEPSQMMWWWVESAKKDDAEFVVTSAIVGEIQRLLSGKTQLQGPKPGDVQGAAVDFCARHAAVLTATNRQAAHVARVLRAAGIPAINRSQESVYSSEAASDVATILASLSAPGDGALARTAVCTRLWGGTQRLLTGPSDQLSRELSLVRALARAWRFLRVLGIVGRILRHQQTRARIMGESGGERYLTDLLHVSELANAVGEQPASVLGWLQRQRDASAHGSGLGDAARLHLEDDGDAVSVMTVHAAKGLEWPVVFAPFLWCSPKQKDPRVNLKAELLNARPICYRDPQGWIWDYRPNVPLHHGVAADTDSRSEAVRQAYVALTRAAERTYLAWGPIGERKHALPARSGISLIAGESALEEQHGRAITQAVETRDWLWPDAKLLATVLLLQNFSDGAAKKDLMQAGLAEEYWKHAQPLLESGGWATVIKKGFYVPSGKIPQQRNPPTAADFSTLLGEVPFPGIQRVGLPPQKLPRQPRRREGVLEYAVPQAAVVPAWSITSFTGLTKGAREQDLLGAFGDEAVGAYDATPARGIHAFPAGAGPGDCLHRIIEKADLRQPDGPANRKLIHEVLLGERIAEPQHAAVAELLAELALARIPGTATALSNIPHAVSRHEWAFDLTMRSSAGIAGLATVCGQHADAVLDQTWIPHLNSLKHHDLTGFLTGRVDFIACIEQRWWIVDWKSNRLGNTSVAYTPEALRHDAFEHRYPLQWMLYLIALHRFLSARLPDYSPERHLGGSAYCYVRGLRRDVPEAGWLVHRPTSAFIGALDAALGGHADSYADSHADTEVSA